MYIIITVSDNDIIGEVKVAGASDILKWALPEIGIKAEKVVLVEPLDEGELDKLLNTGKCSYYQDTAKL